MGKNLLFALALLPLALTAQPLTLEEALAKAEKQNLQIDKKRLALLEKELDTKVVDGLHYGTLDLVGQYARSNHPGNVFGMKSALHQVSFNDFGFDQFLSWMQGGMQGDILSTVPKNLNEPESFGMYEGFLEYKLPIFTGGILSSYKDAAKEMEKIAALDLEKEQSFIKSEVKKVFYDVALLREFLEKLGQIEQNIDTLHKSVEEYKKEGYATNSDVLELRAHKIDIYRNISEVKNNIALLLEYLGFLLEEKIEEIEIVDQKERLKESSFEDAFLLQMAQKGVEAYDALVEAKKGAFYPQIGAMVRSGDAMKNLNDDFSLTQNYTLGVEMRVNLFNGFTAQNELEKAKVQKLGAKNDLGLAKAGTKLFIAQTKNEIKKLEDDILYLESQLDLKEELYNNYKERYKEKLLSMNDLMIKHSEFLKGVLELLHAKNLLNKKIIEFNRHFLERG